MPQERGVADVFAIPDFWRSSLRPDAQLDPAFPACFYTLQSGDDSRIDDSSRLSHDTEVHAHPHPSAEPPVVGHSVFFTWSPCDGQSHLETIANEDANVEHHTNVPAKAGKDDDDAAEHAVEVAVPDDRLELHNARRSLTPPPDDDNAAELIFGDVWINLASAPEKSAGYKTWDSFLRPWEPSSPPVFISEAGPGPYDALLLKSSDPAICHVEKMTYYGALLAVSLGRESVGFQRTGDGVSFTPIYPNPRISGHSAHVLRGLQETCLRNGEMFLSLRAFVKTTYSASATRCGVALASVIDTMLMLVEQTVTMDGSVPRSALQLRATVRRISAVLILFDRLVSKLPPGYSEEDVLEVVFAQAGLADDESCRTRDTMQEVLRRVSQPWVEFLEEWIGTRREVGVSLSRDEPGRRRHFVKVEAEVFLDGGGFEVRKVDFQLDRERIPSFIPEDVACDMLKTGRNLRFIRERHPDHILAGPGQAAVPPRTDWLFDWVAVRDREQEIAAYFKSLTRLISRRNSHAGQIFAERSDSLHKADGGGLRVFGMDELQIEASIAASVQKLNEPIGTIPDSNADPLAGIIHRQLCDHSMTTPGQPTLGIAPHWSLVPILSFGGIVSAQASIINRESLRLLFKSHGLRGHLNILREFLLLGNGLFSARLTHALFDPDMETAERKAGAILHGGAAMGLRLTGRDNWPPASSELRLALAGLLSESYTSLSNARGPAKPGPGSTGSFGDLSFAVRQLASEEDIDRCLDPDSLEALDFLRLTYDPPSPLGSIISPSVLAQYDRVFMFLLRFLRMLYVVGQVARDVKSKSTKREGAPDRDMASVRMAFEAAHFVTSVSSYILDTGIAAHWRKFERLLDRLEADLERTDEHASSSPGGLHHSPDRIRGEHDRVLGNIVASLLLRKRQRPVMRILEEILGLILRFAKETRLFALGLHPRQSQGPDSRETYHAFKQKVRQFVTVCRGMADGDQQGAHRKPTGAGGTGVVGSEAGGGSIAQLVTKLDLGDYYSSSQVVLPS